METRTASRPLRLLHGIVFLGFGAATMAAVSSEWMHLSFALSRPFHFGEPPSVVAILSGLLALVGTAVMIAFIARARPVPLFLSVVLLLAFIGALVFREQPPRAFRTWGSTDLAILEQARALHLEQARVLQTQASVPRDLKAWQRALDTVSASTHALSPARSRSFQPIPYQVALLETPDALPKPLIPGTIAVYVPEDAVSFELTPIGFSAAGEVAPLEDQAGVRVVLRGVFNPDLPRPE